MGIGRTARAGQSGRSVLMLLPHEDSYVPFLKKRGMAIEEMPALTASGGSAGTTDADSNAVALKRTRRLVETDRAVMLKANKAFVSFIRAYQEHQLPYIFPFKSLDLGALAMGFCVLRLPRVKEILGRKIKGFVNSEVHPNEVPFKDKKQEKLRQQKLEKKREEEEAGAVEAEKAQRKKEREIEKAKKNAEKERTRTQKRKAARKGRADEWDVLGREESLAKRFRSGKIRASQFQKGVSKVPKSNGKFDDESGSDESDDDGGDDEKWLKRRKKRRGRKK